ncbi:hypothetical protein [Bartonella sp. HY406]|uniref:hypothetical protein n=1 Tax=Bartonella sp. HY406 TaxID=2979331 RepID=UPI0021CA4657|nr:hypothetical protein [Bartonella sp. HY406]UXN03862.1 hypothetical protein N6B01_02135 [Bartonella sp. HY406]
MANFIQTDGNSQSLLKAGVKLACEEIAAVTKDGFIVQLGHPEAVAVAGTVGNYEGVDNTNGQDGDVTAYVWSTVPSNFKIFASDLTEKFDAKLENLYQQVFASSAKTLHLVPGAGRLPIGVLTSIKKNFTTDPNRDPNEIYYELDTSKISAVYRS